MFQEIKNTLETLFVNHFGCKPNSFIPLPQGGSNRRYFRLSNQNQSVIGAYNPDIDENRTFCYFTQHFTGLGLNVPSLLQVNDDQSYYLLSDLGDETLFNKLIATNWVDSNSSNCTVDLLKDTLNRLIEFQVHGAIGLDFSRCYQKSDFDHQSILWDFNYFKYCFLKPSGIKFNEAKLDNDFQIYSQLLLSQPSGYFHYRDFQSRNVMIFHGKPYFIDYQGGRRGPLLYDVASFLYQAKANIPQPIRNELFNYYIDKVSNLVTIDKAEYYKIFPFFVLFRIIQTLGAYGYRGFFERKAHFLQSIPVASSNLKQIIANLENDIVPIPSLIEILELIYQKFGEPNEQTEAFDGLTIEVNSFSLVKGYPLEHPIHGGGFVFDCRALQNPGRIEEFKMLTGLDIAVSNYLNQMPDAQEFYANVMSIVMPAINEYKHRGFKHLSISFGCTGGQHRSVFMANRLINELKSIENIRVKVNHRELNRLNSGKEIVRKEGQ